MVRSPRYFVKGDPMDDHQDRSAVMDDDRRLHDHGPAARNQERLDDDIAEQGRANPHGDRDVPREEDRQSER